MKRECSDSFLRRGIWLCCILLLHFAQWGIQAWVQTWMPGAVTLTLCAMKINFPFLHSPPKTPASLVDQQCIFIPALHSVLLYRCLGFLSLWWHSWWSKNYFVPQDVYEKAFLSRRDMQSSLEKVYFLLHYFLIASALNEFTKSWHAIEKLCRTN